MTRRSPIISDRATKALREMIVQHFSHSPMQAVVVGDLIARVGDWTGAKPGEVLDMLRGASPASRAGADGEAAVATAVAGDARLARSSRATGLPPRSSPH